MKILLNKARHSRLLGTGTMTAVLVMMSVNASSGKAIMYCPNLSPRSNVALTRWFVNEKHEKFLKFP